MTTKQKRRSLMMPSAKPSDATANPSSPAEDIPSFSEKMGNTSHAALSKMKRFFDRSSTLDNLDDIQQLSDEDLKPLKDFNEAVINYPKTHIYARIVLGNLANMSQSFMNQPSVDKGVSGLFEIIRKIYKFLLEEDTPKKIDKQSVPLDPPVRNALDVLAKLALVTSASIQFIRNYPTTRRFWKKTGKDVLSETLAIVNDYVNKFEDLTKHYEDATAPEISIKTYREIGDSSLDDLACADGTGLIDVMACLDGTRTEALTEIVNWLLDTNESDPRIIWINGQDGAGKSSVAQTVVRWFTTTGGLGACFCFARDRLVERREERIFTTIARDLARSESTFRRALVEVVSKDRSLKTTNDVAVQWQRLVLEPLLKVSKGIIGNVIVLIDDLCDSGPDTSRSHILSFLASKEAAHLPKNLRVLVTSRPLPDIETVLGAAPHVKTISLDENLEQSARDITFYATQDVVRQRDIKEAEIKEVVERSKGSFETARLWCEYMKRNRPGQTARERWIELRDLKPTGRRTLMDGALELVLEGIIPNDWLTVSRFQSVMKQVMSTKKPMTIDELNEERKHFSDKAHIYDVGIIVTFMRPLLLGISDRNTPVRLRHGSFYDCVTDPERSLTYFVCLVSELH